MNRNKNKPIRESPLILAELLRLARDGTPDISKIRFSTIAPPGGDIDRELKSKLSETQYGNAGQWWIDIRKHGATHLIKIINEVKTDLALQAA
eukprot:CAMPEP_0185816692 /NCGR_PEP_ID=MMETSP1322-20130828/17935_1 /TAXON_ID=265543 /ORGANISM="Minutocellus polymorphus, Strain RCC2270" /LENGTH=92 /DNA_ID=CAMNT_0028513659 /DNA_START=44 /DNA_END=319 /DNA_ORIENTATION=+